MILRKNTGIRDNNNQTLYEGDYILFDKDNKLSNKPVAIKWLGFLSEEDKIINCIEEDFNVYNPNCCTVCKNGLGTVCSLSEAICIGGDFVIVGNIFNSL